VLDFAAPAVELGPVRPLVAATVAALAEAARGIGAAVAQGGGQVELTNLDRALQALHAQVHERWKRSTSS
jgi:hypothetical protein